MGKDSICKLASAGFKGSLLMISRSNMELKSFITNGLIKGSLSMVSGIKRVSILKKMA